MTIATILLAASSSAQTVGDAALAECQAEHSLFTEVRECLPATEFAHRMIDMIRTDDLFHHLDTTVLEWCEEHNERTTQTWACVSYAVLEAKELLDMVGDASRIQDQRFALIADRDIFERIDQEMNRARQQLGTAIFRNMMAAKYFE